MKISEFISDKLYVILISLFISIVLALFLYSLQISFAVCIMLLILYWILPCSFLIVEYTRRYAYYQNLLDTCSSWIRNI